MTEYQPYGVRHFLRALDPEGASERRTRPVTLRTGGVLDKAQYADIDAFALADVLVYRTLVLRSSPLASPAAVCVSAGVERAILRGLAAAAGSAGRARASVARHGDSTRKECRPAARCYGSARSPPAAADICWRLHGVRRRSSSLAGTRRFRRAGSRGSMRGRCCRPASGVLRVPFTVAPGGRLSFWLGGSFRGRMRLSVDGRTVGSARDRARGDGAADAVRVGAARAGSARGRTRLRGPGCGPEAAARRFCVGPLAVGVPATAAGSSGSLRPRRRRCADGGSTGSRRIAPAR